MQEKDKGKDQRGGVRSYKLKFIEIWELFLQYNQFILFDRIYILQVYVVFFYGELNFELEEGEEELEGC